MNTNNWIDYDATPINTYQNKEAGITIKEYDNNRLTETYLPDAWVDEYVTFQYVIDYLELTDSDYNASEDTVIVYDIMSIFNGTAKRGLDYQIYKKRAKQLFCRKFDLSVGDTIYSQYSGLVTLKEDDPRLKNPLETQGYYMYNLRGGEKYDLWIQNPDKFSRYSPSHHGWLWSNG